MQNFEILRKSKGQNARHTKSAKIGWSLFIVFILSFTPSLYAHNFGGPISGYFRFAFWINNLANFFIYFFIDEEFRVKLREKFN